MKECVRNVRMSEVGTNETCMLMGRALSRDLAQPLISFRISDIPRDSFILRLTMNTRIRNSAFQLTAVAKSVFPALSNPDSHFVNQRLLTEWLLLLLFLHFTIGLIT